MPMTQVIFSGTASSWTGSRRASRNTLFESWDPGHSFWYHNCPTREEPLCDPLVTWGYGSGEPHEVSLLYNNIEEQSPTIRTMYFSTLYVSQFRRYRHLKRQWYHFHGKSVKILNVLPYCLVPRLAWSEDGNWHYEQPRALKINARMDSYNSVKFCRRRMGRIIY